MEIGETEPKDIHFPNLDAVLPRTELPERLKKTFCAAIPRSGVRKFYAAFRRGVALRRPSELSSNSRHARAPIGTKIQAPRFCSGNRCRRAVHRLQGAQVSRLD